MSMSGIWDFNKSLHFMRYEELIFLTWIVFTPPQAVVIWLIRPKSTDAGKFDTLTLQLGFCTIGTARRLLFCTVECGLICWNCCTGGLPEVSIVRRDGLGLCITCGVGVDRGYRWWLEEWLKTEEKSWFAEKWYAYTYHFLHMLFLTHIWFVLCCDIGSSTHCICLRLLLTIVDWPTGEAAYLGAEGDPS